MDRVLAVNPGATSTKIGYFEDDVLKMEKEFNRKIVIENYIEEINKIT